MPASPVPCPQCHILLKIPDPAPSGLVIQCPRCRHCFPPPGIELPLEGEAPVFAPGSKPPLASPTPTSSPRPTLVAFTGAGLLVGAVLLGGGGLALGLYLSRHPTAEPTQAAQALPAATQDPIRTDPLANSSTERNREKYIEQMARGKLWMEEKRYHEAAQAFAAALQLLPEDPEAEVWLKAARAAQPPPARDPGQPDQGQKAFAHFLELGQEAVKNKQYAAAVQAFQSAVGLRPEDAGANQALVDAQKALEADQAEKKKLADFEDHLAAGKAALAAQRYADALREFLAAQRLLPEDLAADQGRQEAEKRLAELDRENKGKADYTRLLEKGGTALQNHRFEEAVRAYQEAKKLFPRDPDVLQGLQDATKALTDARADFTRLMNQGDAAMLAERFDEAVQAYGDASRLFPNDDKAAQVLRRAQQVLDGVQGSGGMYARWMLQGATALRLRHFREAVRCFSEALRLAPGDLDAAQGLQEARAGLSDVVRVKATFDQLMQAGAAAYQQHRYGDAVQAFSQALALFPDDLTAAGSLQKASYAQHMAEGQAALGAKRYTDAAQAFQNALNDLPGDLAASNALTLARSYLKK